jgi:regulator of sigma E protease
MARRAGVRVEEFGFGLPPRIWGIRRGDTIYSINWLPIGGFVRVLGEDGKSFAPDSMQSKTAGQRASFLAAGSAMNFITAFVIVALLVIFQGQPQANVYVVGVQPDTPAAAAGWLPGDRFVAVDGRPVDDAGDVIDRIHAHAGEPLQVVLERADEEITTTVTPLAERMATGGRVGIELNDSLVAELSVRDVPEGSAAAGAGLQEDDVIVAVDGRPVEDYLSYATYVRSHANQTIELTVEREGQLLPLSFEVPADPKVDGEPLGETMLQEIQFEKVPLSEIPSQTVRQFFGTIERMFDGIVSLITGETPLDDLAGPIGMGQLTSEVIDESPLPLWVTIGNLMFILSLNLGLLNLLPLPALDGGRLLFVLIEVVRRGKRVAPEKEGLVHLVGMALLLTLMLAIAFLDIDRIISGGSFLE